MWLLGERTNAKMETVVLLSIAPKEHEETQATLKSSASHWVNLHSLKAGKK